MKRTETTKAMAVARGFFHCEESATPFGGFGGGNLHSVAYRTLNDSLRNVSCPFLSNALNTLTSQWLAIGSRLIRSAASIGEVLELGGRLRALFFDLLSKGAYERHVSLSTIVVELVGVVLFPIQQPLLQIFGRRRRRTSPFWTVSLTFCVMGWLATVSIAD